MKFSHFFFIVIYKSSQTTLIIAFWQKRIILQNLIQYFAELFARPSLFSQTIKKKSNNLNILELCTVQEFKDVSVLSMPVQW